MCRVISYLGTPLDLDILLFRLDSSLVDQVVDPKLFYMLNLAGFGLAAWSSTSRNPDEPFVYRETRLPLYDRNLRRLSHKLSAECVLGHIRATDFAGDGPVPLVALPDLHPFHFEGCKIMMAHNGGLARFGDIKFALLEHIDPRLSRQIEGTTDSEWIYALLLSHLEDPFAPIDVDEMEDAIKRMLKLLRTIRRRHGIEMASPMNLFITDGERIVISRYTIDYGCYAGMIERFYFLYQSLWYSLGSDLGEYDGEWKMIGGDKPPTSILVASEPLTEDRSTWIEMQEYSILSAWRQDGVLNWRTRDLDC